MAWIELHQTIWTHRKTLLLASELELDETYAAAHLIRFWTWALDNAREGDVSGLPDKVIAFAAGWKGDPSLFVAALIQSAWLDRVGDITVIHDWQDYAGRWIEKRKEDTERKRRARAARVLRTSVGQHKDSPKDGAPYLTVPNLTTTTDKSVVVEAQENQTDDRPTAIAAPLENKSLEKTQWEPPEFFAPVAALDDYRPKNYAGLTQKIQDTCAQAGVDPRLVCANFALYYQGNAEANRWRDPVAALTRTLPLEIDKAAQASRAPPALRNGSHNGHHQPASRFEDQEATLAEFRRLAKRFPAHGPGPPQ